MNQRISCKILSGSLAEHLTQIYTGFGELEKRGLLNLKVSRDRHFEPGQMAPARLKVVVNDHLKIIYDTFDGQEIFLDDLAWCDFYFKRSYNPEVHTEESISPLGFNYTVYGSNDYSSRRILWSLQSYRPGDSIIKLAIPLVHSSLFLSKLFNINNSRFTSQIRSFEDLPRFDLPPKIIFKTRVWNPI